MEVALTHYSLVSNHEAGNEHPKSWCLDVSREGGSWEEVHRIQDSSDLIGANKIEIYEIAKLWRCRFVRLRQTGPNRRNSHYLLLCGFEIFGLLSEE
jgi:hypothetical protein